MRIAPIWGINDMNGKLLKSQKMLNGVENVIDVSALPAGVYYCTIRRNDEVGRVRNRSHSDNDIID